MYLRSTKTANHFESFKLAKGSTHTIGRDGGACDVQVDAETASRIHARLKISSDEEVTIYDLGSTNGLYVNGLKCTERTLKTDDRISLGDANKNHLVLSTDSPPDAHADNEFSTLKLKVKARKSWSIGRDKNNEISLQNIATASSKHAIVRWVRGDIIIQDAGSTNGTWVNGVAIKKKKLSPVDVVFIGACMLRFELVDDATIKVSKSSWHASIHLEALKLTRTIKQKQLLKDINLSIRPGEFVGILGPSGAGKTTLLMALNGFAPPSSGAILINELPLFRSHELCRNIIGYVPQDDVLYTDLSVLDTLMYTGKLRLPKDTTDHELENIARKTIADLGLERVADSRISTLSGGQRKRVSVGIEMLTEPGLLFLDEPTSGLDPSTEEKLMLRLKEMSEHGTTILITTHILYNLHLLDKVIFLANGQLSFYGTPEEALSYFKIDGLPVNKPTEIFELLEGAHSLRDTLSGKNMRNSQENIARDFADQFVASPLYAKYVTDTFSDFASSLYHLDNSAEQNTNTDSIELMSRPLKQSGGTPMLKFSLAELITLIQRNFSLKMASPKTLLIYLMVPFLLGAMTLTMFNAGHPDNAQLLTEKTQISDQISSAGPGADKLIRKLLSPDSEKFNTPSADLVFSLHHETIANLPVSLSTTIILVMTAIFCGTLSACLEISSEKDIFLREKMNGQASLSYVLSKVPFLFLLSATQIFIICLFCLIEPSLRAANLVGIGFSLLLIAWVSNSIGLFVSALDPSNGRYSVIIAIAFILPQFVLSGALGPEYYLGLSELTKTVANTMPAKWGVELLMNVMYVGYADTLGWIKHFVSDQMGLQFHDAVYLKSVLVFISQMVIYLLLTTYFVNRRDPLRS